MRISSGILKYREIKWQGIGNMTRPTLARVRQCICNVINNIYSHPLKILDLYAGSGIMGMELLSIKGYHCTFVDINPQLCKRLNKYIRTFKVEDKCKVHNINAFYFLSNSITRNEQFDIIMLDPPYDTYYLIPKIINKLINYQLIHENGTIIIETKIEYKKFFQENLNLEYTSKFLADSMIIFIHMNKCNLFTKDISKTS